MPFDYLQQPEIRELSSVMALGNVDCTVPFAQLHPKAIRHMIFHTSQVTEIVCNNITIEGGYECC